MSEIRVSTLCVVALALGSGSLAQEPLKIHLQAGTARETTAQQDKELESAYRAAQKTFGEVEKSLKKQHGKNVEAWPEAAQDELRLSRDAMAQAETDWFYSGIKQKDIEDTLRDLNEKIGEKTTVKLAPSAAESDLDVLVIGRGKVTRDLGWGGAEAAAEVAMRVSPGGRMDAAALAKSGTSFRAKKSAWSRAGAFTIHDLTAEAPYWLLISRKPQVGFSFPWKGAAGQAADAFERFAAENGTQLASARKTN